MHTSGRMLCKAYQYFFIPLSVDNYKTYGRMQTAEESLDIEKKVISMLNANGIEYHIVSNGLGAFNELHL